MNSKTAIVIGIAAVVVIGGIVAAVLIANGGSDDSKYVIYYGNGAEMKEGGTSQKFTETTVKGGDILKDPKYFITWNTKSDGTGDKYSPGQEVKLGTKLYAILGSHIVNIGTAMDTAESMGLTLTFSDDTSDNRELNPKMVISKGGEFTLVISGWYQVSKGTEENVIGKVTEDGDRIKMFTEIDGDSSATAEFSVIEKTVYIKYTYSNTSDFSVSLPYMTSYIVNIGNAMYSVDGLGLTMTFSDDTSESRPLNYQMELSGSGEFTLAISGWYHVVKGIGENVIGKVAEDANEIQMYTEINGDDSATAEFSVVEKTVYIKYTYSNSSDFSVSLPYAV